MQLRGSVQKTGENQYGCKFSFHWKITEKYVVKTCFKQTIHPKIIISSSFCCTSVLTFHEKQNENLRKMSWSLFAIIVNNDEKNAILHQKRIKCMNFMDHLYLWFSSAFCPFWCLESSSPYYCYCTEKNHNIPLRMLHATDINKYFDFRIIFTRNAVFTWPCPDWRTLREQWAHLDVRMDGHQEQSGLQSDREAVGVKPCHLPLQVAGWGKYPVRNNSLSPGSTDHEATGIVHVGANILLIVIVQRKTAIQRKMQIFKQNTL